MSRMLRSVSAEYRKLRATKLWWILGIVLAVYSAMMAAVFGLLFGTIASELGDTALDLTPEQVSGNVYSSVTAFGYVVPLLVGALTATSEMRHNTLAGAFIAEPKRWIVLLGKLIVLVGLGALLGVIGLIGAVGAGAGVLAATDSATMLGSSDTWALLLRVVAATALWAVIGFGVGVLVKNQAFAIVVALVFTQFLEPVLRSAAIVWEWSAEVGKYLPGAATDAFVGASAMTFASGDASGSGSLPIWAGLLVLLAYAVTAVAGGWAARWRRDIHA